MNADATQKAKSYDQQSEKKDCEQLTEMEGLDGFM